MPERSMDWLKQAEKDLRHAKNSIESQDYEWSCFAAQQAADKAVKALYQKEHMDAWGHTISILLSELKAHVPLTVPDTIIDEAKILDNPISRPDIRMDLKAGHHFIFIQKKRLKKLSESRSISLSTVRVISVDTQKIEEFLNNYKKFLKKKNVSKAFLFGSWAKGNYSPYSDLDILVIIDSSSKKMRDRSPDFLPRHAPVGIDVFVFTTEEAQRSPFVKNILKEAIPLIE